MIECIKDDEGNIIAVCEWLVFNKEAVLDYEGTIVYVAELEISVKHRGNGVIKKFIGLIAKKCPTVKDVVFLREYKYPGRKPKTYKKERLLRRM
jgi:hypothetical protein